MLKIGIIGAGGMGREHVTNLAALPDVEIVVVADIIADSAQAAASPVGAEVSTSPAAVAARTDIDAVVIASPDDTHADLAIAAIETGLAVLCEKPLAVTATDAARVVEAEAAAGRALLQVGFMRQYDPAHRQVQTAMADLGQLHHLRFVHRNTNQQWTRSLDTVCSQSLIHDVHSARWLSQSEFTSVVTQVVTNGNRIEHVVVLGELASGASTTIEFVEATYGYDVEVEATCGGGMVVAAQPTQPQVRQFGASHRHIGDDWFGRFRLAYQLEVADWTEGVRAGRVPGPTAADGLAAQQVIDATIASAKSGQRVTVAS